MRAIIQRVTSSHVSVNGEITGQIKNGLNILIGISVNDTIEDIEYMKDKIINLRIFEDENGKMNKSLLDVKGEVLIISQFTLYGDCRKGRRPNFMNAMSGKDAEKIYDAFVESFKNIGISTATGIFGADMKVSIENDGPVTLIVESKNG